MNFLRGFTFSMRRSLRAGLHAVAFVLFALWMGLTLSFAPAQAQSYPAKPINLIVPFAAGGAADILARAIGEPMTRDLGQPIVIVNRGGAGTIIGVEAVARAAPDGYTILLSGDAGVINTASGRKLPYDLMKDLTPVSTVYSGAQILLVKKDSPFNSIQDLVKHAKANPGKVRFGSTGVGTSVHLSSESFNQAAGIKAIHVPYKGVAPAMNDLAGGHIDYVIGGSTAAIPAVKSGSHKALAIMSKTRSQLLPELPSVVEQGVNVETGSWYGLFVPAGTPQEVVNRLHASLTKTLASKDMTERLRSLGGEPRPMSQEQFTSFLRSEIQKLTVLMRQLDIKLE
jgi:tripartite-type tricarboxylate transporter receptor subunit TctC